MPEESSYGAPQWQAESSIMAPPPQATRGPLQPPEEDVIDHSVKLYGDPYSKPGHPFLRHLQENVPDILGMLATLLIPGGLAARPLIGPLVRTGVGSLVSGITKTAQTRDIGEGLEAMGRFGLSQGIGESAGAAGLTLYDYLKTGKLGAAAIKQYKEAVAAREQFLSQQKASYTEQVNARDADLTAYKQAVQQQEAQYATRAAAEAEQQIARIADQVKSQVPAYKDLPSTSEGAWQMAHGLPTLEVNKAFEAGLLRSLPPPGMTSIEVWIEDAKALKLSPTASGSSRLGSKTLVMTDAHDAAMAVLGKGKTNPGLYHRVIRALDEANVGDAANNAMYRSAQAYIKFADKAKIFDPTTHRFLPENAQEGLNKIIAGREMLSRKASELFSKIEAAKPLARPTSLPEPFTRPIPKPVVPPEIPPSGVTKGETSIGHLLGLLSGLYAGHLAGYPYFGAAIGAGLGQKLGPSIPTYRGVLRPPLGILERRIRRVGPTAAGAGVRATWDYILQDELPSPAQFGPLNPQPKNPSPESEEKQ